MATKLIVLDWNGTLFRMLDDRVLARHLAKAVLGAAGRQVLRGRLGALAVFGGFALGRVETLPQDRRDPGALYEMSSLDTSLPNLREEAIEFAQRTFLER